MAINFPNFHLEEFVGKGELPALRVSSSSGGSSGSSTQLEVYLFGGHATSWTVNGEEQLFVSSIAVYDGKKAIRGGIPIVFPQFGAGVRLLHHYIYVVIFKPTIFDQLSQNPL
jgi:hypothetical protein